jgi:hypothetical protein
MLSNLCSSALLARWLCYNCKAVQCFFCFAGTPNYASLGSLLRIPQTPRDDLEALVYCLLVSNDCKHVPPSQAQLIAFVLLHVWQQIPYEGTWSILRWCPACLRADIALCMRHLCRSWSRRPTTCHGT